MANLRKADDDFLATGSEGGAEGAWSLIRDSEEEEEEEEEEEMMASLGGFAEMFDESGRP